MSCRQLPPNCSYRRNPLAHQLHRGRRIRSCAILFLSVGAARTPFRRRPGAIAWGRKFKHQLPRHRQGERLGQQLGRRGRPRGKPAVGVARRAGDRGRFGGAGGDGAAVEPEGADLGVAEVAELTQAGEAGLLVTVFVVVVMLPVPAANDGGQVPAGAPMWGHRGGGGASRGRGCGGGGGGRIWADLPPRHRGGAAGNRPWYGEDLTYRKEEKPWPEP